MMSIRTLTLIPLLTLAACGGPPIANDQQVADAQHDGGVPPPSLPAPNETAPATIDPSPIEVDPTRAPAATEPPPAQPVSRDAAIPAAFHGRYAFNAAGCAKRGSEGQLVIDPGALRFYESVGTATRVEPLSAGVVRITARYTGEGESWTATHRLALGDDKRLTITGDDGRAVGRVRCA